MKCHLCKKRKGTVEYIKKYVCSECFSRIIEKRIRKELRVRKLIRKNDKLLVFDGLSLYFLKKILTMPVKTVFKKLDVVVDETIFTNKTLEKLKSKHKTNKTIVPWTLDNETSYFLESLMENKKPRYISYVDGFVKLFRTIQEDELIQFAKIKKMGFKLMKANTAKEILDVMDSKYSETKFSLLKSIEEVKGLLQ